MNVMEDYDSLYKELKDNEVSYTATPEEINQLSDEVSFLFSRGVTLKKEYEHHLFIQKMLQERREKEGKEKMPSFSPSSFSFKVEKPVAEKPFPRVESLTKEELIAYLSSLPKDKDNQEIYSLLFSLAKERKSYVDLLSSFSVDERDMVYEEIDEIDEKIDWIQEYLNPVFEEEISIGGAKNQLVFLETAKGNPCALNDIKAGDIKEEVYPSLITLFQSIEDGTFLRLRKLVSSSNFYEVKLNQSRVLFTRIYGNYYCIISCFVKKSNWEKGLNERKNGLMALYTAQEKIMYRALEEKDSEYLERQQETLEQLYQLLDSKGKKGAYVKWMK